MDLISAIIPIYNVEKYLNQCIESVGNQTYKNLEIILVDDGSTDNSAEICDCWAKKDERIKVIHLKNGGAGRARNIGIEAATGQWISFIDSDDYISAKFYEYLLGYTTDEVDVVECDYLTCDNDTASFDDTLKGEFQIYSSIDALYEHITGHYFKQVIWNKLYRSSVIKGIRFPEGKLIDDEFWTYKVLGKARELVTFKNKLYAYRQQEQSLMHKKFSIERLQALEAKKERLDYIEKSFPKLKSLAKIDLWYTCMYLGQMSILNLDDDNSDNSFFLIKNTIKNYPLNKMEIASLTIDYRIWAMCSKISIKFVCKLRNFLKLGI